MNSIMHEQNITTPPQYRDTFGVSDLPSSFIRPTTSHCRGCVTGRPGLLFGGTLAWN